MSQPFISSVEDIYGVIGRSPRAMFLADEWRQIAELIRLHGDNPTACRFLLNSWSYVVSLILLEIPGCRELVEKAIEKGCLPKTT